MKRRCSSKSAFLNLRGLVGLFLVLAGASLALLGPEALSATASSFAKARQEYRALNYGSDEALADLSKQKFKPVCASARFETIRPRTTQKLDEDRQTISHDPSTKTPHIRQIE
jgi:hypothetical protein